MTKPSRFLLFPIGCLRLDKSLHEVTEADLEIVLQRCVNLHLVHAMADVDADDAQAIAAADAEAQRQGYGSDTEWTDDEIRLLYASKRSGIVHGEKHLPKILKQVERSRREVTTGFSRVALPSKLFWEAVQEWKYRDFAVLCSVYSAIGQASYRRVSFDKITRGSFGYGTKAEFARLPKGVEPLTRQQVRATVDRLEARGLFCRCPVNRRHTAYSKRLGLIELQHAIADRNAKRSQPSQADRLREVERLTSIKVGEATTKQVGQPAATKPAQVSQPPKQPAVGIDKPKPVHLTQVAPTRSGQSVLGVAPKATPSQAEIAARLQAIERLAAE